MNVVSLTEKKIVPTQERLGTRTEIQLPRFCSWECREVMSQGAHRGVVPVIFVGHPDASGGAREGGIMGCFPLQTAAANPAQTRLGS